MLRPFIGLVPAWGWCLLAALVLASAAAAGHRTGAAGVQARWDAAELERTRQQLTDVRRNADRAIAASDAYQRDRTAVARSLRESRDALSIALRTPISCPPSGQLGDLVLPGGLLDGVRRAAAAGGAD